MLIVVFFQLVVVALRRDYQRHCTRGRNQYIVLIAGRLRVRVVWLFLAGCRGTVSGSKKWRISPLSERPLVRRASGLALPWADPISDLPVGVGIFPHLKSLLVVGLSDAGEHVE